MLQNINFPIIYSFYIDNGISLCDTVVKEPPYQVSETGYGGFTMPIDVYLKNNAEPKKIRFQYELFLGTVGTVTHNRCEKITFQLPSPLFRERLVNGGAVSTRIYCHERWLYFCCRPV